MILSTCIFAISMIGPSFGCGGGARTSSSIPSSTQVGLNDLHLLPDAAVIEQGGKVSFSLTADSTSVDINDCIWETSDSSVLAPAGNGTYVGNNVGSSRITATCHGKSTFGSVLVTTKTNPNAIVISSGGTYSGNWTSLDPNVPAITVLTDDPVTIKNSIVSGRGDLIAIYGGKKSGGHVTVDNVTGLGLDPGVAGKTRGKFVGGETVSSLSVTHCTMQGVSFGVYVVSSKMDSLKIRDNLATNLEDRPSDGKGGLLSRRTTLGHFIMLNGVVATNGGDISWNQNINAIGQASVEDLINFYQSRGGSAANPINVSNNYLQGALSTGQTSPYTGGGIQMDGASDDASTATGFVQIMNNIVVPLQGFGISIGAGHDISVIGNRIVSCGRDSSGNWIAMPGAVALGMWNYYQTHQYYNNLISNNSGGLLELDANGNPVNGDLFAPSVSAALNNVVLSNDFDNPCFVNGIFSSTPESQERQAWVVKLSTSNELIGDQH